MAAPAYRTASAQSGTGAATSVAVTKPAGLAVGDYIDLFLEFFSATGTVITTPANWVEEITQAAQAANTSSGRRFWKIADAADVAASTFTFSWTGSVSFAYDVAAYTGVDPNAPINTKASATSASSTAQTCPAVTPTFNNTLLVCALGFEANSTITSGAVSNLTTAARINASGGMGDTAGPAAGVSSGTKAFTIGTAKECATTTIALTPLIAAPTGLTAIVINT